jgi:glutathione S-transferase
MIKLYFAPQSRAFRILWLLEEMKAPYQLEALNLKTADHKSPKFLALNPMGKVPAVEVNGKVVWESPAIVAHLTDLHPECGLAPKVGTPARADFYRWLSFSTAVLEPAFMDHVTQQTPNPSAAGWGTFESMKKALATAFKPGPWVLGDAFSGADIMLGSNLNWFCMWKKASFEDVPGLLDYVGRIQSRDAFKKATVLEAEVLASFEK